ncbi:glycosyltransferase family 4 protein [Enterobacter mori]|uniref:glycosyltransferase family 4 protein n=1 Tax=Enterobacter mori TaxID=539813 RepID=UPI003753E904
MFENILFINESPIYGGHEEMFLRHLREISKSNYLYITLIVNDRNKRLIDEVNSLAEKKESIDLKLIKHHFLGLPLRPITNILCLKDLYWLLKKIKFIKPSKIVLIQGTIEIGGLSLFAARCAGKYTSTYLPITKKSQDIGVKFGGVRDFINKHFYYRLPHEIITISEFNKLELINNFAIEESKIRVVKNFIDAPSDIFSKKNQKKNNILLIIGRIDLNQKRQDLFLDYFVNSELSSFFEVHIIGDGNDEASQAIRDKFRGKHNIVFCGWMSSNEVGQRLAQSRAVIIPSKFEGVPLVMIEAVKSGKVVIASNVDGMKEYLPKEWLFDVDEMSDALRVISYLKENPKKLDDLLPAIQTQFQEIFDPSENSNNFMNLINSR